MILESKSNKNFDDTVKWIEETVTENNWKVLAIHDLQDSMKKNGYEVVPVKVFAICQPHHAFKILGKDDERIVSSMMPCRISVYQKSDGETYLSRMDTAMMAANYEGAIKEVMEITSKEIEEMIKPLFN